MLYLVEYGGRPARNTDRPPSEQYHNGETASGTARCYRLYRFARSGASSDGALVASPDWAAIEDLPFGHFLNRYYADAGSIRNLSRQTGVPYSTLQGILSGSVQQPSARTVARLEAAYENSPITRVGRRRTVADDAVMWTPEKLANLAPPPNATKFQLVGTGLGRESGGARSMYIDLETHHPADFLNEPGFNIRALQRVVWAGFDE